MIQEEEQKEQNWSLENPDKLAENLEMSNVSNLCSLTPLSEHGFGFAM